MSDLQRKLNARQELFCQSLLVGKSADQAYADAGYKPSRPHASRLATNGNVLARLAELRKPVTKAAQVTLEGHLRDLKIVRNMATTAGQFGAAMANDVSMLGDDSMATTIAQLGAPLVISEQSVSVPRPVMFAA